MRKILFILLSCFALALISCKTIYVPQVETRTEYVDRVVRDTTIAHDSVFVREYIKGDTIHITEYKYKTLYRSVIQSDTIIQQDTIYKDRVVEKVVVEKYKPKYLVVLAWVGIFAVFSVIAYIVIRRRFKISG